MKAKRSALADCGANVEAVVCGVGRDVSGDGGRLSGNVLVVGGRGVVGGGVTIAVLAIVTLGAVSYTHLTLPTICSV